MMNLHTARTLMGFVVPYRRAAALSTLFITLTVVVNLIPPFLYRALVDHGIREGNGASITGYAALVLLAIAASALMQMLEEYCSCRFGLVMMNDVRNRLYAHLQRLPLDFFHHHSIGGIVGRFTGDLLNLQRVVARTLPSILTNTLMIALSLGMMLYLSVQLTLVTLCALPLYALFSARVAGIVARINAQALRLGDRMITALTEDFSIEGALFFKLFGMQRSRLEAFEATTAQIQHTRLRLSLWGRANSVTIDLIQSVGVIAVYYIGGHALIDGHMTLGTIVAFATIAVKLYQPIAFFSSSAIDLPTAMLSVERINAYLAEPAPAAPAAATPAPVRPGAGNDTAAAVVFEGVHFRYPGAAPDSGLRDVSFTVGEGDKIAIVGPNGSGKTTLLMLMAGIVRPDQGAIHIAGQAIGALPQSAIPALIGIGLGQGFFLNASIRDNLLAVRPDATEAQMHDALRRGECAPFIAGLPDGLDTMLGQAGLRLSSGQRQRLSLARLFLKGADILCFDETTANIDAETEELIVAAIGNASRSQTSIVISHNLTTVARAERVLVMDGGRLVAVGTHAELLLRSEVYRRLFGRAVNQETDVEAGA
jgi:ATP-binding cassette subfamily B protein